MIRYRDYWFWIDDRDLPSKGVFSSLMFLFTLTESGSGQVSPVLTVLPADRCRAQSEKEYRNAEDICVAAGYCRRLFYGRSRSSLILTT